MSLKTNGLPSSSMEAYKDHSMTQSQIRFTATYIKKAQMICESFFKRKQLICEGRPLEAISMKPSGIWYGKVYASALHSLKMDPVPVREKSIPAQELFNLLRERFDFFCIKGVQTYWKRVSNKETTVGFERATLQMVDGVNPAQAFKSLTENLTFLDCTIVLQVAIYLALLETYGEERFNQEIGKMGQIFLGKISNDLVQQIKTSCHSVDCLSSEVGFKLGQCFYLSNAGDYPNKHPFGEADGYNLVYIGDNKQGAPLFIGLGLNPNGVTLTEVAETLLHEYNESPIPPDLILPKSHAEKYRLTINFKAGEQEMSVPFDDFPDYLNGKKHLDSIPPQAFSLLVPQYNKKRAIIEKKITIRELLANPSLFSPKKTYLAINHTAIEQLFGPLP